MKTITIILIGLMFVSILIWLRNEWKEGRGASPDDLLHMLNFKIENCMMDDGNEIYIMKEIRQLKMNPSIDREKLAKLEYKFEKRYKVLHEADEFSPESIFGKVKKNNIPLSN